MGTASPARTSTRSVGRAHDRRSSAPGEEGTPEELLEPFDALLLVGGGDVDPARYGAEPGEHLYGIEPDRDEFEIALLRTADRLAVPTLCICRGMQVMNVAFGGRSTSISPTTRT